MEEISYSSDLETEPLKRLFWKYTIPSILSLMVNGLYLVVDGFFVGRYVGASGLAAMNLLWPLYGLIFGVGGMVGMSAASLFSIEKGKGNYQEARHYLANGFLSLIIYTIPLIFLFRYATRPFLNMQIKDVPDVMTEGVNYMSVIGPMCFFSMTSMAVSMFIRNDDRPKLATWLSVVCALTNMVGDYVFIRHFGWGMKGAAVATVMAQLVGSGYGFWYFFSKKANVRLNWTDMRLSFKKCRKITVLGISSLMMCFYYGFTTACYNYSFAKYGGAVSVAAFSVVGYIAYMYFLFGQGFSSGVQPILSYNYGAKRYYNIRRLMASAARLLVYLYVVFLAVVYGFPDALVGIFVQNDPELAAAAVHGLKLNLITCVLEDLILLGTSYFQSVDKARQATFVSAVNLGIQIPFILVLPHFWGIDGVWLSYPLANIPLSIFLFLIIMADIRKNTARLKEWHRARQQQTGIVS